MQCFRDVAMTSFHPFGRSKRPLVSMRRATGRVVEALEDRTLFAWNLAIGLTPSQNVSASTAGNTVTYAAVGTGAILDWSDVTGSLAAGHSVVISSGTTGTQAGNITDGTGMQSGLVPPNLNLTLESGSGTGLIGNISIDNVLLNGSNASITIDANGGVVTGLLSSGTSLNPTPLATVLITAANGSIQSAPTREPINATTLALKASTGIGISSLPLTTEVVNLSGRAQAGAIFVSNIGDLNISSSLIPGADGLVDYGAGQISLVNQGSISVTNEAVKTAGQLSVGAAGPNSDIQLNNGGQLYADDEVTAHADRDVLLGLSGEGGSIYSAKGKISVTAGRDVILDNSSQITTDFQGGNISVSAGRNLTIESTTGSKNTLIGTQGGGSISLTTAPGGIFTLDAGAGAQVSNFAPYNPGNITITSDDMVINDPIYDGKNTVTLQQAGTAARNIDLGLGTTPGDLDLSTAAISQITAQTLVIGRLNNPGGILLTAAVTEPLLGYGAPGTLELLSGGSISAAAPGDTVTVPKLAMQASSGIGTSADPLETAVSVLSAQTATGGIFIDNTGNLSIAGGIIPKLMGIWDTSSGDIQLENTGSVNILGAYFVIGLNNVSVAALGASSDIQIGGNGVIAARAIGAVSSGTVTVTAGRDLLVGGGSLGAGNIDGGNTVLSAGRDLIMNGGSYVHGVHSVTATVGRNITLSVTNDLIRTDAGSITLTTGAGGVLTDNGSISSWFGTVSGPIALTAWDMAIAGSVNAAISTIILGVTGSGVVTGTVTAFGLQKTGAGSLSVDGPNGFINAPTTVDAGTLGGTGALARTLTTEPGATLAPGDNAPGILNTGRVVLSSGSTFSVLLGGPTPGNSATNYGQLDASGNVNLNNATLAADLTFVPTSGQTFTLIQATGAISGQFAQGNSVVLNGTTYSIKYLPNSVVLAAQADSLTAQGHDVSASPGSRTVTNATVATFSDANPAATKSDFTATVNWGDGIVSAAQIVQNPNGTFSVIASHTYPNSSISSYSLTIQIVDTGGSTATVTGKALLRPIIRP